MIGIQRECLAETLLRLHVVSDFAEGGPEIIQDLRVGGLPVDQLLIDLQGVSYAPLANAFLPRRMRSGIFSEADRGSATEADLAASTRP